MNKSPLPSPKPSRPSQDPDAKAEPSQPSPTTRPPLQRLPYKKTTSKDSSGQSAPSPRRHESSTAGRLSKMDREGQMETSGEGHVEQGTKERASPDEAELERLRQLQLKLLQKQQRARVSPSNPGTSPGSLGARRVSPIKEESSSTISPTLEASFSSPMATGHTTSTESTESGKTIRGSVPPTPANQPMRTPSYPFPIVPGTPRTWPTAFHQPFTNLSPTVSAMHMRDSVTPRERLVSGESTPAASTTTFLPNRGGAHPSPTIEDPRYPSPSLYDLVLLLGSEPGLTAWWNAVITIMREWYGAERATLAVPADTSDIENVPWAQKSTFNFAGSSEAGPAREPQEIGKGSGKANRREPEASDYKAQMLDKQEVTFPNLTPMERPKLATRHSFAGHERQKKDSPIGS